MKQCDDFPKNNKKNFFENQTPSGVIFNSEDSEDTQTETFISSRLELLHIITYYYTHDDHTQFDYMWQIN